MNESCKGSRYLKVKRPKKNRITVSDVTAVIFAAYMLGGSTSGSYLYISIGLLAVWLLSALAVSPNAVLIMFKDKKYFCFLIYFAFIAIAGFSVAGSLYTAKQMGAAVLLFSPIAFFNYYSGTANKKKLYLTLIIMLLVWIFFCGKALMFYGAYQYAARTLASHRDAYGSVSIGGGYSLAYGASILSVLILELLIAKKISGKWRKLLAAAVVILGILVVLQTESTVTIVCFAVGVLTCLLFRPAKTLEKNKRITPRTLLRLVFFVGFVLVFTAGLKTIGEWTAELTEQATDIVGIRLHSLGAALAGESSEGAYALSRLEIPLKSLKTFLDSPLIGVAYQHGNGFLNSGYFGIGNHCEWADALGNYGLIGGIPFLLIYILQVKEVAKSNVRLSPAWWLVLLLMGMFNPFKSFQSNFAVFFLVPAIVEVTGKREKSILPIVIRQ